MNLNEKNGIQWYSWKSLDSLGIQAGTTCRCRTGGEDYNLALYTGGDKESILQNRRDLCVLLNLDKQAFTAGEQVHSCNSRILNNLPVEPLDETDALLVTAPGILAVIFTADCLPVILYDPAGKRGAVIHAGWKGMARGIIPSVLSRMVEELGSRKEDILAVTGPAIGSCCYQIDTPVFRIMTENFPETKNAFTPDGRNHWRLSLEKAAVQQLIRSGLNPHGIETARICSCCHEDFYSWRGDGAETGRIGTFLTL